MGIAKDGSHRSDYQPGMELHGRYTFFAEGARGHLTKQVKRVFELDANSAPQVYGIGLKELWDVDPAKHRAGRVIHTQGWPLDDAWGGGFIYHQENNQIAIGFVVALNYRNPYLSPFEEFQRFKQHPAVREMLEGGRRVSYGARAINEGGYQAIPKLAFPGGVLIGCSAGFVNVPRIKGSHTAIKSGALAAEAAFEAIAADRSGDSLDTYDTALHQSWVGDELRMVRNVEPMVAKFGGTLGTLMSGTDMWMRYLKVGLPFTMSHHRDHETLWRQDLVKPIPYPKPDGVISFDRLSSVFLSNTNHEEDQPSHLKLKDPTIPTGVNLPVFAGRSSVTAPPASTNMSRKADARGCRSTRRIASTARPATSRTRRRISNGSCRKAEEGRIIPTCKASFAAILAGLLGSVSVAAPATVDDRAILSAYAKARAADTIGASSAAAEGYAAAMLLSPDNELLAARAASQALASGNRDLAVRAARILERKGQLAPDTRLLLLSEALRTRDWKRASIHTDAIEEDKVFAFMTPVLRAWLAFETRKGDPLAILAAARGDQLAATYAAEQRPLLLAARGDTAAVADLIKVSDGAGMRGSRLRIAGAAALARKGKRKEAAALLAAETEPVVAARALLEAESRSRAQ
jgi:flavin-dependent dehydrogenase